ncbi:hypothetical protein [Fimbriimonas ginsengisoli]|uniref:Uncharacterized protein n=1 Tax=Fimbriimonas ginsengisoli Gsoil 348 TaxID=661478 RepID=A0A068NIZ9_FIMGI|nr:hypothetical protein [Fimbriimonas ginsengisoli]AIE83543.1 hypothetical protein OP10G_0175 [Fimbriimonas ginsengisoli Gsoil 348]
MNKPFALVLGGLLALSSAFGSSFAHPHVTLTHARTRHPARLSTPVPETTENSTTSLSAWKRLFSGGVTTARTGVAIRNKSAGNIYLRVAIVPRGGAAPSAVSPDDDTQYVVYAGDTLPLGAVGDGKADIYLRASDDTAVAYRAWEFVGLSDSAHNGGSTTVTIRNTTSAPVSTSDAPLSTLFVYNTDHTIAYMAEADPALVAAAEIASPGSSVNAAIWRVTKFVYSSGDLLRTQKAGTGTFTFVQANYASLTYY